MFSQLVPLTLGGSPRCSPPPPQANPGRSFQDTVGYPQRIEPFIRTLLYSLHNIVPARPHHRQGRNTRCPYTSVLYTLRPRIVAGDHRQETSAEPTKASRLSRLICCCSCLRRGSGHSSVRKIPQTFIIFFFSPSQRARPRFAVVGLRPVSLARKVYICSVSHERSLLIESSRSRWTRHAIRAIQVQPCILRDPILPSLFALSDRIAFYSALRCTANN